MLPDRGRAVAESIEAPLLAAPNYHLRSLGRSPTDPNGRYAGHALSSERRAQARASRHSQDIRRVCKNVWPPGSPAVGFAGRPESVVTSLALQERSPDRHAAAGLFAIGIDWRSNVANSCVSDRASYPGGTISSTFIVEAWDSRRSHRRRGSSRLGDDASPCHRSPHLEVRNRSGYLSEAGPRFPHRRTHYRPGAKR